MTFRAGGTFIREVGLLTSVLVKSPTILFSYGDFLILDVKSSTFGKKFHLAFDWLLWKVE